jgi:MbtH protein
MPHQDDEMLYTVVVNHEEQYSMWPAGKPLPLGWLAVGKTGRQDDCLQYIKEVWTDITPLSVRRSRESVTRKEKS